MSWCPTKKTTSGIPIKFPNVPWLPAPAAGTSTASKLFKSFVPSSISCALARFACGTVITQQRQSAYKDVFRCWNELATASKLGPSRERRFPIASDFSHPTSKAGTCRCTKDDMQHLSQWKIKNKIDKLHLDSQILKLFHDLQTRSLCHGTQSHLWIRRMRVSNGHL